MPGTLSMFDKDLWNEGVASTSTLWKAGTRMFKQHSPDLGSQIQNLVPRLLPDSLFRWEELGP